MPFKTMVTELLWFLRGDTNIKYLVDNNCHIWDGDAYKAYEKWYDTEVVNLPFDKPKRFTQEEFIKAISLDDDFAKRWGELGPIYGKQWRNWNGIDKEAFFNSDNLDERNRDARHGMFYKESEVDQIQNLINDLKTNPDSRRLMVNAWNVGELDQMTLPPCHFSFQCYSHEKKGQRYLSLIWNQRSIDSGLGLPFNIASYGLLLEIIAKEVNMVPYELIGNFGDCHIYNNHIEGIKEQLTREPYPLPKLICKDEYWYLNDVDITFSEKIEKFKPDFFKVENYQSHPSIKLPLSN
jgi:thymidylate synthase